MSNPVNWDSPRYYEDSKGMSIKSMDAFRSADSTLRFCWWTGDGGRIVRFVRSSITSDWQDLAIELLKHPVKDTPHD